MKHLDEESFQRLEYRNNSRSKIARDDQCWQLHRSALDPRFGAAAYLRPTRAPTQPSSTHPKSKRSLPWKILSLLGI